jgi:hypothetical protein
MLVSCFIFSKEKEHVILLLTFFTGFEDSRRIHVQSTEEEEIMNTVNIAHLFTNVSIKDIVPRHFVTSCVFVKQIHPVANNGFYLRRAFTGDSLVTRTPVGCHYRYRKGLSIRTKKKLENLGDLTTTFGICYRNQKLG